MEAREAEPEENCISAQLSLQHEHKHLHLTCEAVENYRPFGLVFCKIYPVASGEHRDVV